MNYQYLKDKPTRFESRTGYKLEEFSALLLSFIQYFLEYYATKTLDGKPRKKRRYSTYQTSCLPSFEDKFPKISLIQGVMYLCIRFVTELHLLTNVGELIQWFQKPRILENYKYEARISARRKRSLIL